MIFLQFPPKPGYFWPKFYSRCRIYNPAMGGSTRLSVQFALLSGGLMLEQVEGSSVTAAGLLKYSFTHILFSMSVVLR